MTATDHNALPVAAVHSCHPHNVHNISIANTAKLTQIAHGKLGLALTKHHGGPGQGPLAKKLRPASARSINASAGLLTVALTRLLHTLAGSGWLARLAASGPGKSLGLVLGLACGIGPRGRLCRSCCVKLIGRQALISVFRYLGLGIWPCAWVTLRRRALWNC